MWGCVWYWLYVLFLYLFILFFGYNVIYVRDETSRGPKGSVPLVLRKKMYISIFFTILYLGPHFQKFWAPFPTILHWCHFNSISSVVKYHKTPNLCKSTFVVSKLCKFAQLLLHKLIFCKFTLLLYIYIYIYIYICKWIF